MKYPAIPLTVAPFENTRTYVTEEAPQELDRAIRSFLAGSPQRVEEDWLWRPGPAPRRSRRADRSAEGLDHTAARRSTNGRSGANSSHTTGSGAPEPTRRHITFSGDVLVEGQKLAAGSYAIFTIPTETEWTVVFNRAPGLWGHFYYNPEFDALQVKVKPQAAEHQEWLSYSFEMLSTHLSANVVVHWEKIKTPFKIEAEPAGCGLRN